LIVACLGTGCRFHFDERSDGGNGNSDRDARGDGTDTQGDADVDAPLIPFVSTIEAESGSVVAPFVFTSTGPETYVLDQNTAGQAGAGSLTFTVVIPASGDYYLLARVLTQDSMTDAFDVAFGPLGPFTFDTSECMYSGFWHWTAMRIDGTCSPLSARRTFTLLPGDTDLTFTSREGGSRFDKLVVTNDPSYAPP
jgi:hypothetical protein